MTVPADLDRYINIAEAAALLRIQVSSLRRLIHRGDLPAVSFGGKYLFDREAVLAFRTGYDPRPGRHPAPKRLL